MITVMRRTLNYKPKVKDQFQYDGQINYKSALRILSLNPPITKPIIKERYRELVAYWHPDKKTGNKNVMQAINAAMDYLSGLALPC